MSTERGRSAGRRLLIVAVALAGLAAMPGQALAGPIILGGDDLTDHGSNSGTANREGWLYMEKALGNMSAKVTRANDNSIAALGSSGATSGAGEAIAKAAAPNGLTVTYYEGAAAINGFFAALAAGSVRPKIIWVAGDEGSNDLASPDSCTDSDPATTTEGEALAANAPAIESFVSAGGGVMSHGTCYPWVQALVPGLVVKTDSTGGTGDIALTPEGRSAFPGVSDSDIGAGPWHNYFEGNFGGLQVMARSKSIKDSKGNFAAVFLGGGQVTFTPPDPDLVAARKPACLSIPNVVRDQRANVPGAGQLLLQTRQVDNPAQPLRTSIRLAGRGRIRSVVFRVNGKVTGRTVAVGLLRLGGGRTRPNKVTATVTLTSGRRVVLTQYMIILKCKVPTANCKLAPGGKRMTCSSLTPLSAIRARITVTRGGGQTATGTTAVRRGRYTAILRSTRALTPGVYAFKHVLNTRNPRLRFYMIRLVTVR
jgi:hypothetical protein